MPEKHEGRPPARTAAHATSPQRMVARCGGHHETVPTETVRCLACARRAATPLPPVPDRDADEATWAGFWAAMDPLGPRLRRRLFPGWREPSLQERDWLPSMARDRARAWSA